jgi:predicted  nucleic acid-binding Zn-ribbon protein
LAPYSLHCVLLLQAQLEARAGLAELPGLRARVSTLQQRLQDAQQEAAAAQQAAAAAEQQLAHTRQQLQEANKVRTLELRVCG